MLTSSSYGVRKLLTGFYWVSFPWLSVIIAEAFSIIKTSAFLTTARINNSKIKDPSQLQCMPHDPAPFLGSNTSVRSAHTHTHTLQNTDTTILYLAFHYSSNAVKPQGPWLTKNTPSILVHTSLTLQNTWIIHRCKFVWQHVTAVIWPMHVHVYEFESAAKDGSQDVLGAAVTKGGDGQLITLFLFYTQCMLFSTVAVIH